MAKSLKQLAEEIHSLLDQLVSAAEGGAKTKIKMGKRSSAPKGASGAIQLLIEEEFLNTPKDLAAVEERLREIGHWHRKENLSMNLLNLTKRRVLNRFKNKESKKWEYVIRK